MIWRTQTSADHPTQDCQSRSVSAYRRFERRADDRAGAGFARSPGQPLPPNEGDFRTGFQPFYDYAPTIRDPKTLVRGSISTVIYPASCFKIPGNGWRAYLVFLRLHQYNGTQLLINGRIQSQQQLSDQVKALTL